MNKTPTVCAVMLTANRPELARRAIESFLKQTYDNARLAVLDSSAVPSFENSKDFKVGIFNITEETRAARTTIGSLRNLVAEGVCGGDNNSGPDIFIHWDDDDYSHPNRIAEQVALLQSSGADVVGYREMLFWREPVNDISEVREEYRDEVLKQKTFQGEAWLYQNADTKYALGTSLCYWRRTWERKPFDATSSGEDERFIRGLKVESVSAFRVNTMEPHVNPVIPMIARIHGSNTSGAYKRESMEREARRAKNPMWKRTPEWDKYCSGVMA